MSITLDQARAFLATLDFQRDARAPVVAGRSSRSWRAFARGWAQQQVYTAKTLRQLTWDNLGYRALSTFAAYDPQQVFDAFRAVYAADGPATPQPQMPRARRSARARQRVMELSLREPIEAPPLVDADPALSADPHAMRRAPPTAPAAHTVFLCYAGPDRPLAERLYWALADAGIRAWCDALDLVPGQRWSAEIPKALKASRIMLLLVTDRWPTIGEAGSSHYTRDELALALQHARANRGSMLVVPARLDRVGADRVPYGLNDTVPIMASSDDFGPIVQAIRYMLAAPSSAPPEPRSAPSAGPLAEARRALHDRRAERAPRDVIAAAERRVLALKRKKRQRHKPVEGLDLADRWTLLDRLGRGGFAEVWKAWDRQLNRAVAIKLLHGQFEDSAERRDRFFRGARQMARIDHPNVVRVFEPQAEHDGFHFFVMEWVPGGDLHHEVVAGRVDVPTALRAIIAVAGALAAAHGLGIIHRDVKPANILLTADGRAKLTDFDLVRAGDTTGGTRTGALGTFIYAAPEAMEDASKVTPACDVYSLGMTALFALHGGPLPREVLRRPAHVLSAAMERAKQRGEPVDESTALLILSALDWEPEQRSSLDQLSLGLARSIA